MSITRAMAAMTVVVSLAEAGGSIAPAWAGGQGAEDRRAACTAQPRECAARLAARMKASGWVGVELIEDEATGVYTVERVVPDSPAAAAGVRPGDVLLAINGVLVSTCRDKMLDETRKHWKPGDQVTYTIKRDGHDREITLRLATMPADVLARYIARYLMDLESQP